MDQVGRWRRLRFSLDSAVADADRFVGKREVFTHALVAVHHRVAMHAFDRFRCDHKLAFAMRARSADALRRDATLRVDLVAQNCIEQSIVACVASSPQGPDDCGQQRETKFDDEVGRQTAIGIQPHRPILSGFGHMVQAFRRYAQMYRIAISCEC
jgi:hypothetical protein